MGFDPIIWALGSGGVIFHMFSATHKMLLKHFKAILDTFIFFPCDPPPLNKPDLKFYFIFGLLRGKKKMS